MTGSQLLQTEFGFTLPRGFVDDDGNLHRDGVMRLATAWDEVEPMSDQRIRSNDAYLPVLLLSKVVTRLGDHSPVTPSIIEQLFASDFSFLQEFYLRINDIESSIVETECPGCGRHFLLDVGSTRE